MSLRIGLFGGSFDPVHNAHLALGRVALDELGLDEVRWIPAGQPWQKPNRLAPAGHRAAMVELAIADVQCGDRRFRFDGRELARTGPSYSIDTVEEVQDAEPGHDWFLVLGQDQHQRLHTWHRWRELLDRVTLAVAARASESAAPESDPVRSEVLVQAQAERILDAPAQVHPDVLARGFRRLALPAMAVSSSAIRQRIAAGLPIGALVPAAVARYIDSHRLYRGPGTTLAADDPGRSLSPTTAQELNGHPQTATRHR